MEAVKLDLMTQYHYLSSLEGVEGSLLYVDTVADMENNDYTQSLHKLCNGTDSVLLKDYRRVSFSVLNDGKLLVRNNGVSDFISTSFYKMDVNGKKENGFTLPLAVGSIKDLNDDYYLVQATVDIKHPDYHLYSDEEKMAYKKTLEKEKDYLVLDEYPFFFNAVGFINGTRNGLFLVSKKDLSVRRLTPATMDVESVDVIGDTLYLLANDYESMKKMFASVYAVDLKTCELKEVYHNETIYIRKVFTLKDSVYFVASEKTCISGQSFYKVENGSATVVYATEWMFSNSIGSDCRYGKLKGSVKHGDKIYLLNVIDEKSVVMSFDGENLEQLTDYEGSVDDMTFLGDDLYVISMKDMKLQEVYKVSEKMEQLTCANEAVLCDKYVAKPERFSCFNVHEIRGWALKPKDFDPSKKYPMILDIHGGPKTAYGEVFYHEMQLWASLGYFVIFCNPHCSDGRGDEFSDYLPHYGATDYDDIMAFVDKALEVYPQIDPERLGVTGGSYGGYMTNFIITHTHRFKAAAAQRSISNRVADFYYSDYSYDTTYENGIPLNEDAIKLFWDRSPLKYVEYAETPTLFIQSTEDYRCPFPEALQLFSALKWKGVETRICGFKGENHELSRNGKPLHRLRRLEEITKWMEDHVK